MPMDSRCPGGKGVSMTEKGSRYPGGGGGQVAMGEGASKREKSKGRPGSNRIGSIIGKRHAGYSTWWN